MAQHLQREIEQLKKKILSLGASVEGSVRKAVSSVQQRDTALAERVIAGDVEIDQLEVDLEEDCLKILALHQPVAIDLRFIVAVLKINNDLERIGDLATNISERAVFLASRQQITTPYDLSAIAEKAQVMVRRSLDSLVNLDASLARDVCRMDDDVDALNREAFERAKNAIQRHPEQVDILIAYLSVSRYLERIADHATNIAEDVIYMTEGVIARHRAESPGLTSPGDMSA
ncbi:phosphate transport system regulatory protein PhoU [candidate division GN15 bacterium]|uniref:Phosphate-specific transport system accessory protein PhoU n=1 Tax=candidate division GN15 bacterium TaxID=2072418 RepID=A0A855WXI1_9BACT|nr:MAG: phosphate transport system regulatory protein PhoU [candidate division GN15 bacterium]